MQLLPELKRSLLKGIDFSPPVFAIRAITMATLRRTVAGEEERKIL
jgi:hypothetical protein